jgi:hypothetical protein
MDIVYMGAILAGLLVCRGFAAACEKLGEKQ